MRDERPLGQLLRSARGASSQEKLAERLSMQKQAVSAFERGSRVPSLSVLLRLHDAHVRSGGVAEPDSLACWLLAWLEAEAASSGLGADRLAELEIATEQLQAALVGGSHDRSQRLDNFPDAFSPLTIIGGDRRELTPKSVADTFIYSGAITDLTSLPGLGKRDASIRSDKLAVVLDNDALKNQFGRSNLLVLGSPAVNWVARLVNHLAIFRFDIPRERRDWIDKLMEELRFADPTKLRIYWQVFDILGRQEPKLEELRDSLPADQKRFVDEAEAAEKKLLGGKTPKQVMNWFRGAGIVDPIDGTVHGARTGEDNDFALVSLAPNPWADDGAFVTILVSGIHGPGTTHALRALTTDPKFFEDHPFGGVIEVTMQRFVDWSTRFQSAYYNWQTQPYTGEGLRQKLAKANRDDDANATLTLVDRLLSKDDHESRSSASRGRSAHSRPRGQKSLQ